LRIPQQMKAKQDELSKTRVVAEAEKTLQGYQHLNTEAVNSYVTDLRNILDESEVAQRKAFLKSFVKKIVVEKEELNYTAICQCHRMEGKRTQ